LRDYLGERADWIAGLVREGQERGDLDPELSADAIAHFCLALAAGTTLISPDLHDVEDRAWIDLLIRVVTCLQPTTTREEIGTPI
jgi:hypothetical protein